MGGFDAFTDGMWSQVRSSYKLSPRQSQVLELVFLGLEQWQVAMVLGLSPHTTETHWREAKNRARAADLTEAIHRVYQVLIEIKVQKAVEKATTVVPEVVSVVEPTPAPPPMPVPESRQLPPAIQRD